MTTKLLKANSGTSAICQASAKLPSEISHGINPLFSADSPGAFRPVEKAISQGKIMMNETKSSTAWIRIDFLRSLSLDPIFASSKPAGVYNRTRRPRIKNNWKMVTTAEMSSSRIESADA